MKIFIDEINDVVKNAFEELGYERETGKVTITPVHVLNNGLPTPGDSGEDIVVFQ